MDTLRKIGILENDLAMRKLLQELLEKQGLGFRVFHNPEELKTSEVQLDVLLASVESLSSNGSTRFQEVQKAMPHTSIILVPANGETEKARQLVQEGATAIVNRPFLPWEFSHNVKLGCELAELRRRNEWLRRKEVREPNTELKSIIEDEPSLDELEKRYIEIVLKKTGGRKDKASKMLGINRRTLYRKEREYGWVPSLTASSETAKVAQTQ